MTPSNGNYRYHYKRYKTILSPSNSVNLYRGCTHGCIYCDSRSECYQFTHDFEDIEVKEDAISILSAELSKKKKKYMLGTGSMTDPYMPLEEKIGLTRKFLEKAYETYNGVALLTKSDLVLRDLDIIKKINERTRFVLQMTLTTASDELCALLEPGVALTSRRAEVLRIFSDNNIDTIVWMTPILPFINDTIENIDKIIDYCAEAKVKGILLFGIGVTLRKGNREYFYEHLDKYFPGIKNKYIKKYGNKYSINAANENELHNHFVRRCRENKILYKVDEIFAFIGKMRSKQLSIFEV